MIYPTIADFVGKTPLVRLQRIPGGGAITGHDQEQVKAQIGQRAFGLDVKAVARDPGPQSRQGQLISRHGTPFGCARSPVTQLRTLLH